MSALQAYAAAGQHLQEALIDSTWTAAVEQTTGYESLPPAVILDVDETVLDNSPYQARLVWSGDAFEQTSWSRWVREVSAEPVPGALEFTRTAHNLGVAVFYVTGRVHELEEATRLNLEKWGFPLGEEHTVLTRGERESWGSDKSSRRAYVAARYRILLLIGDDLNDFVSGARVSPAERATLVERYRERWGRRWVILPNPTYGSWEGSLYGFEQGLARDARLERKYDRLDSRTSAER
jgi:acid phosphatase